MDVALDLYNKTGPANVWARHQRYTDAIVAAAQALGLQPFAQAEVRSVTVTALHVPAGIDGDGVRKALRTEHGYVLGGGQARLAGKIIRIGTMGDVSQTDIVAMLGALEMNLLAAGLKVNAGAAQQAALRVFLHAGQPALA
jgi:aspartate aminotransferase-like enzyme